MQKTAALLWLNWKGTYDIIHCLCSLVSFFYNQNTTDFTWHLVLLLLKFELWEIFLSQGFTFPGFSFDTSSNHFSLASGPALTLLSLKTQIETDLFSERKPHL